MKEYSLDQEMRNELGSIEIRPGDGPRAFAGAGSIIRLFKHSARAHLEERQTDRAHILRSLRTLAAFARFMQPSGIEWHASGGIALDLIKKSSYRQHGDLDVVIPIEHAEAFGNFLGRAGLSLYRRVCTARYYADERLTLFRRCLPSYADFGNNRTLKLFMGPHSRVLPVVDVHFASRAAGGCAILCNRKIEFVPFPLASDVVIPVHGCSISCCDLRLMLYMKSDANPRNIRDASRIAECLPRSDVERVLRLKQSPIPAPVTQIRTAGRTLHSYRIVSTRRL